MIQKKVKWGRYIARGEYANSGFKPKHEDAVPFMLTACRDYERMLNNGEKAKG